MGGRLGRVLVDGKDHGAGFALGPRLVVTANHVIRGYGDKPVTYVPTGDHPIAVERIQPDADHDVAVLWLMDDVGEFLPASVATRGAGWLVASPPVASNDPHLHGTISADRITIQNATGSSVEVVQLTVDELLGDFGGYSGSAVLDPLGQAVLALLVEQKPLRTLAAIGERTPVSNVLYGVPINDIVASNELQVHNFSPVQSRELERFIRPVSANPSGIRRKIRSPATLLRPEVAIVNFEGREKVRAKLKLWCADQLPVSARLLCGPGGQGKTRLAQELIKDQSASGWISGFLKIDGRTKGDPPASLRPLINTRPLVPGVLLTIDYAETRIDQVTRLLEMLSESAEMPRIRLLLIARSAGEWWSELKRRHADLLEGTEEILLGSLNTDYLSKSVAFQAAVRSYASEDALAAIYPEHNWQKISEEILLPADLSDISFGSPLTLQMRALTSLLERAQVVPVDLGYGFEERLLNHEQVYWSDAADQAGLPFDALYKRHMLSRFVAAANLFGARTKSDAMHVLSRIHAWNDPETIGGVAEWLHWLYPADDSQGYWGSLQPDRIAEYHLRSLAHQNENLLQTLFNGATPDDGQRATPLLIRAARLHDELIDQLEGLIQSEALACREALISVILMARRPTTGAQNNLEVSERDSGFSMTGSAVRPGGVVSWKPLKRK